MFENLKKLREKKIKIICVKQQSELACPVDIFLEGHAEIVINKLLTRLKEFKPVGNIGSLVIGTNNDAVINFFGHAIAGHIFSSDFFLVEVHQNKKIIHTTKFKKDGTLDEGWKFGWFLWDVDKSMKSLREIIRTGLKTGRVF